MSKDYYEILGLPKTASIDDIKKSYRKLALDNHPDRLPENLKANGEEKFKIICEAYNVLSDPEKKNRYDRGEDPEGKSQQNFEEMGGVNISQIFQNAFGGFGPFNGMPFPPFFGMNNMSNNNQQNNDEILNLTVPLELMYRGVNVNVSYNRKGKCVKCSGTGSDDGKDYQCSKCKGSGNMTQIRRNGIIQTMTTVICDSCNGNKFIGNYKSCDQCNGSKIMDETINLEICIPSSAQPNEILKLYGKGSFKFDRMEYGDLLIKLNEDPTPSSTGIKRDPTNPDNLRISLDLKLEEALCGFRKTINHLDGHIVEICYGNVCNPQTKLIVNDEGMKMREGRSAGNLIVDINIIFPNEIRNRKELWELLSDSKFDNPETSSNISHVIIK